jgi:hypothetical protein
MVMDERERDLEVGTLHHIISDIPVYNNAQHVGSRHTSHTITDINIRVCNSIRDCMHGISTAIGPVKVSQCNP